MKYHMVEPEVIVGMGDNTEMDSTQHPPVVSELHIELEDWLGDDLIENFPCYIVTDALAQGLQSKDFNGFEFSSMELTLGEYFRNNYQLSKSLPDFHWLKVLGKANEDDFGMNDEMRLIVSARAWEFISKNYDVKYARVDKPSDLDDLFAGL